MVVLSCAVEAGKHISVYVGRIQITCGPLHANSFFCNTVIKGEISGLFIGKISYVI